MYRRAGPPDLGIGRRRVSRTGGESHAWAPSNAAMMKYMNIKKVPQLLAATGASKFGDPKNFPWTMGFSTSVYRIESAIYAQYILANYPDGKVAVLFPNDDYGRDIYSGFKD